MKNNNLLILFALLFILLVSGALLLVKIKNTFITPQTNTPSQNIDTTHTEQPLPQQKAEQELQSLPQKTETLFFPPLPKQEEEADFPPLPKLKGHELPPSLRSTALPPKAQPHNPTRLAPVAEHYTPPTPMVHDMSKSVAPQAQAEALVKPPREGVLVVQTSDFTPEQKQNITELLPIFQTVFPRDISLSLARLYVRPLSGPVMAYQTSKHFAEKGPYSINEKQFQELWRKINAWRAQKEQLKSQSPQK